MRIFGLQTGSGSEILNRINAGLVQWQYACFPSMRREFDSRIPLRRRRSSRWKAGSTAHDASSTVPFRSFSEEGFSYPAHERMLTPAHIAASYLISQIPLLFGKPLSTYEIIAVIVAGNIVDVDLLVGSFLNKRGDDHHRFFSHTPIFTLFLWVISFIFFRQSFQIIIWILIFIAGLVHLLLDDTGYWFASLGWQKISRYPQINWLYPFTSFQKRKDKRTYGMFFKDYLLYARINLLTETILIALAICVFLLQQ